MPVVRSPHAGKAVAQSKHRFCTSPSNCPWTRPATPLERGVDYNYFHSMPNERRVSSNPSRNVSPMGAKRSRVTPGRGDPFRPLVLLLANFLTSALASQRGFYPFLFTGFQVKGVALDLLDNVFLLYFALEAAQRVLEGFTLLQPNFRQTNTPPNPSGRTE